MTTPSLYAPLGLQKVDPTFDQQLLCQLLNVWPILFHQLACLADHFVE
jgi:hypothetical protein